MVYGNNKGCSFFGYYVEFKVFVLRIHQNQKLNCDTCSKVFFTITALKQHRQKEHFLEEEEEEVEEDDRDFNAGEVVVEDVRTLEPLLVTRNGIVQDQAR